MMLYSGSNDVLADPFNVQQLVSALEANNMEFLTWKEIPKYAHLDYGKHSTPFHIFHFPNMKQFGLWMLLTKSILR